MRVYSSPSRLLGFLLLCELGLDLNYTPYSGMSTSNWSKIHSLELRKEWHPSWFVELRMEGHVMSLIALLLPILVYQWDLLSFSLLVFLDATLFSDGKAIDFLDSCSIPFPFLLYFYLSCSFLLVRKENLYHLLTTLRCMFSCIFSTLSLQLFCLGPFHFLNPDAFSVRVWIQRVETLPPCLFLKASRLYHIILGLSNSIWYLRNRTPFLNLPQALQ